jgi:hypothetical protein
MISQTTAGLSMAQIQAVCFVLFCLFVCLSACLSGGYERRNKMCWLSWTLRFNLSFFGEVSQTTFRLDVSFSSEGIMRSHIVVLVTVCTHVLNWTVVEPRVLQ